jgi:hypothetical protein
VKPYVVRKLRLAPVLQMVVVTAFLFLGPRLLGLSGFPVIFVAVFIATGLWYGWQATLVLRVDDAGVRLLHRTPQRNRRDVAVIPWTSIHELVLTEDDPPQFAVRLKNGAPLPAGVRGVIHDPDRPTTAPELTVELPRADRNALTIAIGGRVALRSA